jgi:cell division control protein 45
MLNCGGGVDLDELFELESLPNVTLYVIDSHRPYHPENVANKQQILLFDDGVEYEETEGANDDLMNTNAAFYGSTVAGLTYALASQLNKANNELLWYALVGLSDQFLHQKIDEERYMSDVVHFKTEVLNRNMQDDEASAEQFVDQHRILVSEEYKFFLYRHWNLYDSMYHSKYVAVRLGVWQSNGRRRLEMLLAKMGVPLDQCRASYLTMNKSFKDQLHLKLAEHGKDFQLDQLTYPSFIKKQHCDMVVSAADTVWAVTALLDLPVHDAQDTDLAAATSHYHEQLKRNFWVAYDALSRCVTGVKCCATDT